MGKPLSTGLYHVFRLVFMFGACFGVFVFCPGCKKSCILRVNFCSISNCHFQRRYGVKRLESSRNLEIGCFGLAKFLYRFCGVWVRFRAYSGF